MVAGSCLPAQCQTAAGCGGAVAASPCPQLHLWRQPELLLLLLRQGLLPCHPCQAAVALLLQLLLGQPLRPLLQHLMVPRCLSAHAHQSQQAGLTALLLSPSSWQTQVVRSPCLQQRLLGPSQDRQSHLVPQGKPQQLHARTLQVLGDAALTRRHALLSPEPRTAFAPHHRAS